MELNPYTLENVRIRYRAKNNAKAYAYGLDMRLNGEFVPGTESWFSFGYLKTEENIENRGYIARPTDQRMLDLLTHPHFLPSADVLTLVPRLFASDQEHTASLLAAEARGCQVFLRMSGVRAGWMLMQIAERSKANAQTNADTHTHTHTYSHKPSHRMPQH